MMNTRMADIVPVNETVTASIVAKDETAYLLLKRINSTFVTNLETLMKSSKSEDEAHALCALICGCARHLVTISEPATEELK